MKRHEDLRPRRRFVVSVSGTAETGTIWRIGSVVGTCAKALRCAGQSFANSYLKNQTCLGSVNNVCGWFQKNVLA